MAAGALALLSATPGVAAPDHRAEWQGAERRVGAFAGVAVKMAVGARAKSSPAARLQLGFTQSYRATGSGAPFRTSFQGSALELALFNGKPMLFVGGKSAESYKRRAQLNGGNSWLYIAGGLAIAGAAFLILSDDGTNAEPCFPGNC